MPPVPPEQLSAVILAGGQSRRMNGRNKAFVELHGLPMIRWVIERLRPQVTDVFIAGDVADPRYQSLCEDLGLELLADPMTPNYGPLAGVLAGLERADTRYVLTAPCDMPFLPGSLATRLYQHGQYTGARAVTVFDGMRMQGTLSLLDRELAGDLRAHLEQGGRQVRAWLAHINSQSVDFSGQADAFVNINSDDDIKRTETLWPAD